MRAWEPEEDDIIMMLLDQLGPKWSLFVKQLPGRSVSSVRNRWQRIDKGNKMRAAGQESRNRCQRCGEPKRGHVCRARGENAAKSKDCKVVNETAERDQFKDNESSVAMQLDPAGSVLLPFLGRMESAGRICSELGFNTFAAAAAIHVSRADHGLSVLDTTLPLSVAPELSPMRTDVILPATVIERQISAPPPVPPISRMPTLLRSPSRPPSGVGTKCKFVLEADLIADASVMDNDVAALHIAMGSPDAEVAA